MALHCRISRASRVRSELALLRALAGGALAVLSYAGFTTAAIGPQHKEVVVPPIGRETARIVQQGDDVIITGSIAHMFSAGAFSGPNRAEKQDRARTAPDVLEIAQSFAGIRARLATLRMPPAEQITTAAPTDAPAPPAENVRIASLEAPVSAAALEAIEDAADPAGVAPVPMTMPEKLAYARADVPATVFDGIVRDKRGKKISEKELNCLATAIYFEARGESYRGQVAVGQVVLNRVAHRLYPSTICAVVFQNQHKRNACQFSFACDGIPERVTDRESWEKAEEIAKGVASGELYLTEVGYATHYHATYVYPHWAPRMTKVTKIGLHVFYHFKRGWKFG